MKKWIVFFAIVFIGLIIFGRYGYVMYGSFGFDTDGYIADQDGKSAAYKVHGAYNQAEIDNCFRRIGVNPDPKNLEKIADEILSGKKDASRALKKCIEEKVDGYASPKKDVKAAAKAIKDAVTPEPKPEQVFKGNVAPQLGGAFISSAEVGYRYTVHITGCRSQYNWDSVARKFIYADVCAGGQLLHYGNSVWYEKDQRIGQKMLDMTQPQYLAVLRIDDQDHFIGDNFYTFAPTRNVNLLLTNNAPQEPEFFSRSKGGYDVLVTRIKL